MRCTSGTFCTAILVFLGGCASMSAEDCSVADWQLLGLDDGSKGLTLARAEARESACAKHGFVMDRAAYESGRNSGLSNYCTPGTAYQLGESGGSYNGVCVQHNEHAFLAAFERGRELYAFTTAYETARLELSNARSRHKTLDEKLDRYQEGYRDEDLTMAEHNNMVLELWAERKYLATKAIPYWQNAESNLKAALSDYRTRAAGATLAAGVSPPAFPGPAPYSGATKEDAREMLREVFSSLSTASTR